MPATATVDGVLIAQADKFQLVEGNVYFPPSSIIDSSKVLVPATRTSQCPWKGEGHYYDLNVNGKTIENAAWYYPQPLPGAVKIKDYVAFYTNKVKVETNTVEGEKDGKHHGLMHKMMHPFNK